jgi:hypothetical protein
LFKVAIAAAQRMPVGRHRDGVFAAIVESAADAAELDIARDTAEFIRDRSARDAADYCLAAAMAKLGRFDQALAIADGVRNTKWRDFAYEQLAIAEAAAKKVGDAQRTASLIVEAGLKERTLQSIEKSPPSGSYGYGPEAEDTVPRPGEHDARALLESAASPEAALERARELTDPVVKAEALALIAAGRAKAGEVERALRIAQEIEPTTSCVDTCDTRRDLTIAEIAGIQAATGDRAGAFATAGLLSDAARDNALLAIAESEMVDDRALPTAAIGTAATMQRPDLRARVFNEIASALAQRLYYCEWMRHGAGIDSDPKGWRLTCP